MTEPAVPRILVVEDDPAMLELLEDELATAGYAVTTAPDLATARLRLAERSSCDLLISDLRLPDGDGMSLVAIAQALAVPPAILLITAFGSVQQAVAAVKTGADDFLTKPLDLDHLRHTCRRLLEHRQLRTELARYRQQEAAGDRYQGLIGASAAMHALYQRVRQIAAADGAVLIQGESGTGKELVARALHVDSSRRNGPFVAVNCGGVPAELIESEFFGHAAGAFTGARQARRGLFQEADGGTLLLDEIAELPLQLQAKLLRTLQDGTLRPVGSDREQQVDVRVVAASHRDLREMVAAGTFREDLYYRLETFTLAVPPLRDRKGDVALLVRHFLAQSSLARERAIAGIDEGALQLLERYPFPGNVRELFNALEHAVAFCSGGAIGVAHLPPRLLEEADSEGRACATSDSAVPPPFPAGLPTLAELQNRYVAQVLEHTAGNKQRAAAILGVTRRTLYRWLDRGQD